MTEPTNPESTPAEPTPAEPTLTDESRTADDSETAEQASAKPKISVGRTGPLPTNPPAAAPAQKFVGERRPRERKEKNAKRDKPMAQLEPIRVKAVVPPPSRRDRLSEDLEAEINAALGDVSIDELVRGSTATHVGEILENDTKLRATVVRVHGDNVFFSLTGNNEGVASIRQFATPPQPGAVLEVIIRGHNQEDGLYEVSVPGASIDVSDWADIVEGSVVDARVTGFNAGGLECMINNIRGFIPASQVSLYRVENLAEFVDQKLQCVVTESNPLRRNLVLSHRAVLERQKEQAREQLMKELEVGQTREGVVRSLRDFGAFVDLGGVDGLIHISQLSWDRVSHPSEVLHEGQKVKVKVEKIDSDTGKIGLSYKDALDDPWQNIQDRYPVGAVVKGTVSRLAKFGAFVKLAPGVEGLVHISEISHQRVRNLGSVVQEGAEVEVKVLSVDAENQRIGLSLKATTASPEEAKAAEEGDDPARQPVIARSNVPLKGGTDRPTGGDQFGLKW